MKKMFFLSLLLFTPLANTQMPESPKVLEKNPTLAPEDNLIKELEMLGKAAEQKPTALPFTKIKKQPVKAKSPESETSILEKELSKFMDNEIVPISNDMAQIVKGKQFNELVKAKIKKRPEIAAKAKSKDKKDYGRGRSSSAPWSRSPDYEKPYRAPSSSKDSGYWGSGADSWGQQPSYTPTSSTPFDSSTTAPTPSVDQTKSPTTLGTESKVGSEDKDKDKEQKTGFASTEKSALIKSLDSQIADITDQINTWSKPFTDAKTPAEREKLYTEQSSESYWKTNADFFNNLLKSADSVKSEITKYWKFEKDDTKPSNAEIDAAKKTLQQTLSSSLSLLLPHALEISSRLKQPATGTKGSLDDAKAILGKFTTLGVSTTESIKKLVSDNAATIGTISISADKKDEASNQESHDKIFRLQNLLSFAGPGLKDEDKKSATEAIEKYQKAMAVTKEAMKKANKSDDEVQKALEHLELPGLISPQPAKTP
jgi:hypothetical protein